VRALDLIIRQATVAGAAQPVDIGVRGERIARIGPAIAETSPNEIDAAGRMVTPSLVETHVHLDAVLTVGQPRHNLTGSLFEGIEIWGERVKTLTREDVIRRANQAKFVGCWPVASPTSARTWTCAIRR